MTAQLPPKVLERIQKLLAVIKAPSKDGKDNTQEIRNAKDQLLKLLAKYGHTWDDVPAIMAEIHTAKAEAAAATATRAADWQGPGGYDLGIPRNDLLGIMLALIDTYILVTPEEALTICLWVLHTWVYRRYTVTPRLLVICPVFNCGKTTVLKFINELAYETDLVGGTTTASIYQQIDETPGTTLLIDEVEKLRLMNDQRMRQLFNIGHEKNGAIRRSVGGRSRKYEVFSPLALAANSPLPGELMSRSIAIFMLRANMRAKLERFNEDDPAFMIVRDAIQKWAGAARSHTILRRRRVFTAVPRTTGVPF
jgi:hypothetical protein